MPTALEESLARLQSSSPSDDEGVVASSDAMAESLKRIKGGKDEDADTDGFISRVLESALKQTSVGIAAQAAGVAGPPPENLRTVESIAAGIGGFVLDPATYLTGGLGNIIGKQAAKKLVTYAAKKGLIGTAAKIAPSAIAAGTQLGGLEAVREVAGGELHPAEIAKATIAGAALGPTGMLPKGLRTAGEVVAMGAVPPLLEGRLPVESQDWITAAGTVGGFKLYRIIKGALARKPADMPPADAVKDAVGEEDFKRIEAALQAPPQGPVTETERRLSAFADQESISRSQYAEATGVTGKVPFAVEREAKVIAAAAKVEKEKTHVEVKTPEALPAQAAEEGAKAQKAEVEPVLEIPKLVQRIEEPGVTSDASKPHGLYTTPADVETPHADLGGKRTVFETSASNPLVVPSDLRVRADKLRPTGGHNELDASAGVGALRQMLPKAEFDRLTGLNKGQLKVELTRKYPSVDWGRYYDGWEMLEGYAGLLARERGYDAIWRPDPRDPQMSEFVALTDKAALAVPVGDAPEDFAFRVVPESPPSDVKGQGVLPKSEAARAEADAKWAELDAYKKKNPTVFSTGVDVKALGLFASAIKSEIKVGVYKFAEFVERIIQKIGKADAKAFEPQIRKAWDDARANDPRLDASTELKPILDASTAPEFPAATTPRPRGLVDLAEQGRTEARRGAMRGVTELRTAVGEPELVSHAEQAAIAAKRLSENPEGWKQKLLEGDWVATETGDVATQKAILDALPEGPELAQGYLAWELGGTVQGRELEARKMGKDQPIEVGQRFFARQAVHQPPPPTAKKMKAAQDRVKRERARQPKPHPLTAGEIPQPEGMMPAPPGVRLPPKPPVQGPETQRNYEARVARAAKKAKELAAQWQLEVAQNKSKLAAMGYDVERAMRGELDPIVQQEFIRDAYALKSTRMDQAYEVWRNAIVSGPATQVTNIVGTSAHGAWYFTAERMADAVVSSSARAMGFKNEGAYFGEIGHIARAMMPAMGKAWANFLTTWRTEIPQFYLSRGLELETPYGHRAPAIPGKLGKRIRAIGYRPLSAFDDLTKTLVAEMETSSMAYRQARNEGLRGKDLDARMRELVADQGSEAHLRGTDTAIRLSFQETTEALKKITGITQQEGVRWLIPFTTTPFNILKTGIRKSPFGALKLAKEVWKARETGDWTHVHPRVAEQVLAWGTTLALAYMNDPANPWITGGTDPNRKYAIKIGGQWYSYGRMEPFATTLGLLVDGINKIHAGGDLYESLKAPFDALLDRVDNQTFFAGISDFMKAARYRDANYVLDWASKFPASWVPNLVRAPIRAADDEVPQRRVWGRGALRAENSLKRGLQAFEVMPDHPRFDLWGRAVPKDGSPIPGTDWVFRTLSPVGQKKYVETIGDRLITKWNATHPGDKAAFRSPNPYFSEDGKEYYFTDDEYATYVRESGRLTQQRVIAAESRGGLNMNNPTDRDVERLERIIETSRTRIRNSIKRARRKAVRNAA